MLQVLNFLLDSYKIMQSEKSIKNGTIPGEIQVRFLLLAMFISLTPVIFQGKQTFANILSLIVFGLQ